MVQSASTTAIVVAAGSGSRAGGALPKQFRTVRGRSLIAHGIAALAVHPAIGEIVLVIAEGQEDLARAALGTLPCPRIVTGGATRRESVRNALAALAQGDPPDRVLVHDAARPFLPGAVIDRLLAGLDDAQGAIPVLPLVDTVARAQGTQLGEAVDRDSLRRVQTPQAFRFASLVAAHAAWPAGQEATDDAQMVRAAGGSVALVEGDAALRKFTFAEDFADAMPAIRVGTGIDVHRLAEGEELWLCGVRIAHDRGLAGHSDADVAIHALVDAILGATGAGDIGMHFPPGDPQWRGASSDRFLAHAVQIAADAGYILGNADVTIICEQPKIGPHRDAMRRRLAEIIGVDIGVLSVKATTTEGLGFAGRGEGIAAQASVTMTRTSGPEIER